MDLVPGIIVSFLPSCHWGTSTSVTYTWMRVELDGLLRLDGEADGLLDRGHVVVRLLVQKWLKDLQESEMEQRGRSGKKVTTCGRVPAYVPSIPVQHAPAVRQANANLFWSLLHRASSMT